MLSLDCKLRLWLKSYGGAAYSLLLLSWSRGGDGTLASAKYLALFCLLKKKRQKEREEKKSHHASFRSISGLDAFGLLWPLLSQPEARS